ncbi:MAG TPA: GNAT family N-acetyltransferase [Bacteroidales bacterium]|nr:GNAT family N-acetyltransferase [Bacteroidales bacterium]HNS46245.1 GNAT family N-acetyltransferase [Bacteroidales bacterium]
MIHYLHHSDIDKTKWDRCIQESFNGLIYGYSWYLDLVSEEWDALVEDDYERVFPLTWKKKAGISYLYQPFFTQQLGIFSRSPITENTVNHFLAAIPSRFRLIEISLNSFNKLTLPDFSVSRNRNHELSLNESYDRLAASYSENIKRSVRKAKNHGLTYQCTISPEEVISLFRRNRGRTVRTLKEKDYRRFRRLVYTCIHNGKAQTWGAYSPDNQLCAGIIFLFGHKRVIFLFSGLAPYGREHGAMPFLIDAFIQQHAQSYLTLDFEGSNDPDLARFYKSFGSKEVFYPFIRKNKLPWVVRMLKNLQAAI